MIWKHGRSKPVIGIVGGIGSGKSTIARLFQRAGCAVIDSDALSHAALQMETVKSRLREIFGAGIFAGDGTIDRRALGRIVFTSPAKRLALEQIVHPQVARQRDVLMAQLLETPTVKAVIWDSPLLFETGLNRECDVLVFVDAPLKLRQDRVRNFRAWTPEELAQREKSQFPLDKKAEIADYCVDNSGDEVASFRQVQQILSQLSVNALRE